MEGDVQETIICVKKDCGIHFGPTPGRCAKCGMFEYPYPPSSLVDWNDNKIRDFSHITKRKDGQC